MVSALCAAGLLAALFLVPAAAQEQAADWRTEFEAVCVKTDLAMNLSSEELTDLVARCDKLVAQISTEGETVRKVYLRRLQSCRSLFAYVLETRAAASGAAAPAAATAPAPPPPAAQPPAAEAPAQQAAPEAAPQDAPEGKPAP
jgi:hypothetical protein